MTPVTSIDAVLERAREAARAEKWAEAAQVLRQARLQPGLVSSRELLDFLVFCLQSQARADPEGAGSLLMEAHLLDPNNEEIRTELDIAMGLRPKPARAGSGVRKPLTIAVMVIAAVLLVALVNTLIMVNQANRRFEQVQQSLGTGVTEEERMPQPPSQPRPSGRSVGGFVVLTAVLTAGSTALLLRLTKKRPGQAG